MILTPEKPSVSNKVHKGKSVLYVAYPYPLVHEHMEAALKTLQRMFAPIYKRNRFIPANALFNVSELVEQKANITIKTMASVAVPMLNGCQAMMVVRGPGWEYDEILINEISYFTSMGSGIIEYVDPY